MLLALTTIAPTTLRLVMLGASAFMLYGAGRLVMGVVPARADRPTLRALLGAAMVLAVAIVAVVMGRPAIALHLPIACAAAAMTIGIGSLILGRDQPTTPSIGNRSWALVAPAVAITLFAGLSGRFDAIPIAALILFGAVAMLAWREVPEPVVAGEPSQIHRGKPTPLAIVLWIGGIALAALAGVLVMLGLPALEATGAPSDPLAVVFLLAPAIVVPIFFELLPPCRSLGWDGSVSVLAKFALINLCFSLPIVALAQADAGLIRGLWQANTVSMTATTAPATMSSQPTVTAVAASTDAATKLEFPNLPAAPLRADLLVLTGAMLLIVPLAAGWQKAGGVEAAALVACYLLSLALVMLSVLWQR
jgi:hypothetical protein